MALIDWPRRPNRVELMVPAALVVGATVGVTVWAGLGVLSLPGVLLLVLAAPLTHTVDRGRVEVELRHARSFVQEALNGCDALERHQRDRRILGCVAGVVLFAIAGVIALSRRRGAR